MNDLYLQIVYVPHQYHGVIDIQKNSRVKSKTLKTECLGEKIAYMKHIKHSHVTRESYLH